MTRCKWAPSFLETDWGKTCWVLESYEHREDWFFSMCAYLSFAEGSWDIAQCMPMDVSYCAPSP